MAPINRITAEDVKAFADRPTLSAYQRAATKSAFYPGQRSAFGLMYVALKLNGEAGELAEHVGKALRDDRLVTFTPQGRGNPESLTEERRALVVKEVGDVLWYLSAACNELGVDLAEVAYGNLCKLCDRGERNVLQGSGDTR
ncbi:MazG family pyrophosphatase [Paracoccus phage vB_PmaS-R3]|uniref:MazG family pyrophosphatase n=1 Tax=Paracoccus phage vB_PmaS-R3 TaxID=2494563 RepID=A0A0B5A0C6_9CAUD|nr:MazG-like pyrophosphatase [Paracoccus phage vB_PmaS-R3]AJD83142.1 MazG family pyrophosphatase [Paracoccus phage vB_PmaS-R3]